ncbi:MAG: T9SS type A sorting domain-containing protein [Flavobacteriales bacterium]|nr:T9SS type A sorting domain-containing protein [Flavobacteriales bacterium]
MRTSELLLLCTLAFFACTLTLNGQTQIGTDIDGEADNDYSGYSVSMPDAQTVAIGAPANTGNGNYAGHVRIYTWNGTEWVQKGSDLVGEESLDYFGRSVSMPDANTVAIGAPYNDGSADNAGHVRIYTWNDAAWVQKGTDINGEYPYEHSGHSLSMPDANTVAIGAPYNGANGYSAGHVRIYNWSGSAWVQKGQDIDAEAAGDESGWSLSMPDANTVAIGAPHNSPTGYYGQVRIYAWNGTTWLQKGTDIDGYGIGEYCGWSVSMPDANTVAIGALDTNGNGYEAGAVRIYTWNGFAWVQKGTGIVGEAAFDHSGYAVSMPDANTVAVGAPDNDGSGTKAGHVRIYAWNGTAWVQQGTDMNGESADDQSGWSVSMPDSHTVAIGAPYNDGNATDAGHVRVYTLGNVGVLENSLNTDLVLSPNPTTGSLSIQLGKSFDEVTVVVRNALGREVQYEQYSSAERLELTLQGNPGIYLIALSSGNGKAVVKVAKK